MKSLSEQPATNFLNVQVTAIPILDENGKVHYETTFSPETLSVTAPDTVINYQLIYPTPEDVVFKSLSVSPESNNQLSTPTVSVSGKLITFSDANTVRMKFKIKLKFTDKDNLESVVDPELDNDPRGLEFTGEPIAMMELDPELDNDPR